MKNITTELKEVLNNETLNLARCWQITTKQGESIGFSTASEEFEYEGVIFNNLTADNIKDLTSNLDIENDKVEISNLISSDFITANDILSGKYDGAKVEIFVVDILNLNKGKITLLNGKISDIKFKDNMFIANVKGLKNEIDKVIGEVYTPLCRASLCDQKCKLNKDLYIFSGTIANIIDVITFFTKEETISNKDNGYFENGVIEFISGKNIGQKTEIKQFSNGIFILSSELPYQLQENDNFNVIAGCDKQFKTCCERFNNAINFRGEPHLPGIELLLKVM